MKQGLNLSNQEMHEIFKSWNDSELDSYLIEITSKILGHKDDNGQYVIDLILDATGQKGTGKWTTIAALDYGQPLTLIGEAVFARCLSSFKEERIKASSILSGSFEASSNCFRMFPDPSVTGGLNSLVNTSSGRSFRNGSRISNSS